LDKRYIIYLQMSIIFWGIKGEKSSDYP